MEQTEYEKFLKSQIDMPLIRRLLDSNISGHKIGYEARMARTTVTGLRNGSKKLEHIELYSAYRLSDYAKKIFHD